MIFKNQYYCTSCRKQIDKLANLLFVEDAPGRCFCSEICIENFFLPFVDYYKGVGEQVLTQDDKELSSKLEDPSLMNNLLYNPDEIWIITNNIGEKVYHFIRKFEEESRVYYGVGALLVYNFTPSFIIFSTLTGDINTINQFKVGERVSDISLFLKRDNESDIGNITDEDLAERLELLKGEILAIHLSKRSDLDIPYEEFLDYDQYLQQTLEFPDEIRIYSNASEQLWCYIKADKCDIGTFYYIIVCLDQGVDDVSGNELVVPVFAFPTIDVDLYSHFRSGEQIFGQDKVN